MMIGVLGSLAEYERELVKERTALKRAASRAKGTKFGRPRKVRAVQDIATAKRMKEDGLPGRSFHDIMSGAREDRPGSPNACGTCARATP
jgi:DNA invertase Pin-like site-specific DNA recombinase